MGQRLSACENTLQEKGLLPGGPWEMGTQAQMRTPASGSFLSPQQGQTQRVTGGWLPTSLCQRAGWPRKP